MNRYPRFEHIAAFVTRLGSGIVELALILWLLPQLGYWTFRVILLTLSNARLKRELEFHRRRLCQ